MTDISQPTALPENTHILYLVDDATEYYKDFSEEPFEHHVAHAFYYSAGPKTWAYQDFTYVTHSQGLDPYGAQLAIRVDGGWEYRNKLYADFQLLRSDMWKAAVHAAKRAA